MVVGLSRRTLAPEDGVHVLGTIQCLAVVHRIQSSIASESGLLDAGCRLLRNRHGDLPVVGKRGVPPVKITKEAFMELFGVHLPKGSPSAWVRGVRYEFVSGTDEIEELESLLGGVISGKP